MVKGKTRETVKIVPAGFIVIINLLNNLLYGIISGDEAILVVGGFRMRRFDFCRGLARGAESGRRLVSLCREIVRRRESPLSRFLLYPGPGDADRLFGLCLDVGCFRRSWGTYSHRADRSRFNPFRVRHRPQDGSERARFLGGVDGFSAFGVQSLPSLLCRHPQDIRSRFAFSGDGLLFFVPRQS